MKKSEKPFFVENLSKQLESATSIVLVDYSGLTVKMQQDLKKRLKEAGAKMVIIKNTLFKLAGEKSKINQNVLNDSVLTGPLALIVTEGDPITPIQVLGKFAKEFEIPQLKVGIVEGSFQDKEGLNRISSLPSKEVLYTQTIGAVSTPIWEIVGVLQGNLQKLIYILKTKASQL